MVSCNHSVLPFTASPTNFRKKDTIFLSLNAGNLVYQYLKSVACTYRVLKPPLNQKFTNKNRYILYIF